MRSDDDAMKLRRASIRRAGADVDSSSRRENNPNPGKRSFSDVALQSTGPALRHFFV